MREPFLPHRKQIRRQGLRRRPASSWGVSALALLVLGVSIGVLPTPASVSRLLGLGFTPAYPCAGGLCGCSSPEQCWTTCRCQPMAQKIAWAREHGVDIPAYVDQRPVALADERGAPACPLCVTDDATDQATRAPSPLPSMSALRCQGIELLMVVPVAPATARVRLDLAPMPARRPVAGLTDQTAPTSMVIDTPAPPPRRAA